MLLARGARPYGRASNGESVLHSCAREGHLELTATLLHQVSLQATEWPFAPSALHAPIIVHTALTLL